MRQADFHYVHPLSSKANLNWPSLYVRTLWSTMTLIKIWPKVLFVWGHSEHGQSDGEQWSPFQNPPQSSHSTGFLHPLSLKRGLMDRKHYSIVYLSHIQLLAEFPGFQLEERGEMDIKGKGKWVAITCGSGKCWQWKVMTSVLMSFFNAFSQTLVILGDLSDIRMVTFWLNGEETSSETESALEQGQCCNKTTFFFF